MKSRSSENKKLFISDVGEKEKLKLRAQRGTKRSVWSGIGLFGMVGWSVAIPTLLGAAFGIWLDKRFARGFSWTLTFLIIGLMVGCGIAWNWVGKENKEMHQNEEEENE